MLIHMMPTNEYLVSSWNIHLYFIAYYAILI